MIRGAANTISACSRLPAWIRLFLCLAVLAALAACGGRPTHHARSNYNPSRYYAPPGPASDPWGPYIREASSRFNVPDLWVRRVMRQESGGQQDVISWAGAMGLMQVMPDTYDGLRSRYNLGDDPFDPHNNILAGTAYLREMYDRFGAPGFLAAYNAGPNRLDRYLRNGTPLPDETVNYVASIAPYLGTESAMTGPLAVYASRGTRFAARPTPAGCDTDAAYDPARPCVPLRPSVARPVVVAAAAPVYQGPCDPDAAYDPSRPCAPIRAPASQPAVVASAYPQGPCDPDAAYDPTRPCTPVREPASQPLVTASIAPSYPLPSCDPEAAYDPSRPCRRVAPAPGPVVAEPLKRRLLEYASGARPIQEMTAQPASFTPVTLPGRWAIQVGAFANLHTAQVAAENARATLPDLLRTAKVELPATTPLGGQVAFRARLAGLSPSMAADACARLSGRGTACMTVPPPRDTF